jgi:hypothetical protein
MAVTRWPAIRPVPSLSAFRQVTGISAARQRRIPITSIATSALYNERRWLWFGFRPFRRRRGGADLIAGGYNNSVATDPYWKILRENWPDIHRLYETYAEKRPVMLYDIEERRVYAYPYAQYRAGLSERSQASLKEQYEDASAGGMLVVFIRDNKKKKMRSYSLPISQTASA